MKIKTFVPLSILALLLVGCSDGKQKEDNIVKVKTITLAPQSAEGEQNYSGTIEEISGTSLSFAGAGTIKYLGVSEGQYVKAGQLIGVIDASNTSNAVALAHAATQQAEESLKQANDAYNRMKMLKDNNSLPEMKWVEVETKVAQARQMLNQAKASENIARKGLADTRLTAPFSGYISRKSADIGQNILPGQPIVNLVSIDRVKVKISVPEEEIAGMSLGQKVTFTVASLGNAQFDATISEKSVEADPISRSYTVKAATDNTSHRLLPGMLCDVRKTSPEGTQTIALPADIIQIDIDNRPFVWTAKGGKAQKEYVVLGGNVGERVVIKSGLLQGEKVIVEGQQKVSNGMKIAEQ